MATLTIMGHAIKLTEPIAGYRAIQCDLDCEHCELTCAQACVRFPDRVCKGCPCLTASEG